MAPDAKRARHSGREAIAVYSTQGGAGRPSFGGLFDADFCTQILVGMRILFEKEIEKKGNALAKIYKIYSLCIAPNATF